MSVESKEKLDQISKSIQDLQKKVTDIAKTVEEKNAERTDRFIDKVDAAGQKSEEIIGGIDTAIDDAEAKKQALQDKVEAKVDAYLDAREAKADERYAQMTGAVAEVKEQVHEDVKTVEGDIEALKENIRLASERGHGQMYAVLLKAQMLIEEAKCKLRQRRASMDAALLEGYIEDRLDYADACVDWSMLCAEEALLAVLEAAHAQEELDELRAPEK